MGTDAGSTTIALLTACAEPELGIRSRVVQEMLDEACADPQTARQVLTTLLTASVLSLEAYTRAAHRTPQEVLQTLGASWSRRTLEV
jgi:hypothetical protein